MAKTSDSQVKPIFRPLSADDPDPEVTEIESLCMNCHKDGLTRILLTKIPFFKEVVLTSFACDHCGFKNNEVQPGGRIDEKGIRITLQVRTTSDLNRQVCKSDYTSIRIPELDFEIPSQSQKGEITSVEGIINRSIEALEQDQAPRREQDPEAAEKIDAFIASLKDLKEEGKHFTMVLEDISGNSHVSNPQAPLKDEQVAVSYFVRTREQDHALGIYEAAEIKSEDEHEEAPGLIKSISAEAYSYENMVQEVMQFPTNCSNCNAPCETNMKLTNIPHFKEVVIMATHCEVCGHRTNEVKSGGGIESKGIRVQIKVSAPEDFTRDILKSDTCSLEIPDLELEVGPGALGGRFTTVEGLLTAMKEQICDSKSMFGDSQDSEAESRMADFLKRFDSLLANAQPFTLILDDPAGNSYVQSLNASTPDAALIITSYERSFEQNDDLGLNDMKTENYHDQ